MRRRLAFALLPLLLGGAGQPFDPFGTATIEERPGAAIPMGLPFTGEDGKATTLRAIGGDKPLLLIPVLHDCPNFCGVTAAGIARSIAAQHYVAGRDFRVVLFGIDPREGREDAAANLRRLGAGGFLGALGDPAALTGGAGAIRATADALGYRYAFDPRIGQYAHVAAAAVLTGEGRLSGWLYGIDPAPASLERAIGAARDHRRAGLADRIILLCYHYDPATGTYTLAIERVLQLLAFLTVAGLAILLMRGIRRQRS